MTCEACGEFHDGLYGSGRFCCKKCARGFSTRANRKEINERVRQKLLGRVRKLKTGDKRLLPRISFSEEELRREVPLAKSWRDLNKRLQLTEHCQRTFQLKRELAKYPDIDVSHFWKVKDIGEILCVRPNQSKGNLRRALLKFGRKYECETCQIGSIWNGKTLTLQVDHKDGDKWNHTPENLRFLCPNCHSQTDTFAWKNAHKKKREAQMNVT